MKTKKRKRGLSFLLAVLVTAACLLTGCGAQKSEAQEDAEAEEKKEEDNGALQSAG